MTTMQTTNATPAAVPLPGALVLLLATGAGLSVASIYYSQPLLGLLGLETGGSPAVLGWIPTLTQLGYALGILFFAPLCDRFDRRRIILGKAAVLVAALLAAGLAPGLGTLMAASLFIGIGATLAQDIVPAAATLAPEAQRGRTVGTVMTGLLLGILLSRVASGFVAEQFGWRSVFFAAALAILALAAALWRGLPRFAPTTRLPYGALLSSLFQLAGRYPALRRAALAQGLLALGFSAFWSTLALMLHAEPFHLGSAAAGAFGLAGAAGALAAPLAGRLADRRGPEVVTRLGAGVAMLSFALMGLGAFADARTQLVLLAVGAIGFDLGVQAALIAHQTLIYALDPAARSRLNAVLMVSMFAGMAAGSTLGSALLAAWGWPGVIALAVAASAAALAVRLAGRA